MADTIQGVMWALGQQCPLRQGADWQNPTTALKTLGDYQTYSDLRKRAGSGFGVFGDICITSVTSAKAADRNAWLDYPSSGFVLSSQFSAAGGVASLHRLCGECPANGDTDGIAGCAGFFGLALYSKELQEQLEGLINQLGLAATLDAVFAKTTLHWFRFWIRSPIPVEGLGPLRQLLEALHEQSSNQQHHGGRTDLRPFVDAIARAANSKLPLHVSLTPPGHTDFGWYTIFSHCPRCKAAAPVERWKRKYPDKEIECAICGVKFSPAKTHSSVRDEYNFTQLRDVLGQAKFEEVAARCLESQGVSTAEAKQIVQMAEAEERIRRAKWAIQVKASEQHAHFVEKVIYRGLKKLRPSAEEEPSSLFSPEDTAEILRRCDENGGKVTHISHFSESGEHDEFSSVSWPNSATKVFQKMRKNGCNEKFLVNARFPKEKVEEWLKQAHD